MRAARGAAAIGVLALLGGAWLALGTSRAATEQADANAPCTLPTYVLRAVGSANTGAMVTLGPPGDRSSDPFAADSDRFVGYRALDTAPLAERTLARLRFALSEKRLACGPPSSKPPEFALGFDLTGAGGAIRIVVQSPTGGVEFELANGRRFERQLTSPGVAAWQRCFEELAAQLGRTPEQLTHELAQPRGAPDSASAAPSTSAGGSGTSSR
jgi:hypothetical protein